MLKAKGGRPSGSSNSNERKQTKEENIAMKNDSSKKYSKLKEDGRRFNNG